MSWKRFIDLINFRCFFPLSIPEIVEDSDVVKVVLQLITLFKMRKYKIHCLMNNIVVFHPLHAFVAIISRKWCNIMRTAPFTFGSYEVPLAKMIVKWCTRFVGSKSVFKMTTYDNTICSKSVYRCLILKKIVLIIQNR